MTAGLLAIVTDSWWTLVLSAPFVSLFTADLTQSVLIVTVSLKHKTHLLRRKKWRMTELKSD